MYCAACGTPLAPGLSYCSRCGASLKERDESHSRAINSFLAAITLIGILGLGVLLGGAIALRKATGVSEELIALFMSLTFLVVAMTEILLVRQLSRLTSGSEKRKESRAFQAPQESINLDARQPRTLPEPIPSVTENTTRTLEYTRGERR